MRTSGVPPLPDRREVWCRLGPAQQTAHAPSPEHVAGVRPEWFEAVGFEDRQCLRCGEPDVVAGCTIGADPAPASLVVHIGPTWRNCRTARVAPAHPRSL